MSSSKAGGLSWLRAGALLMLSGTVAGCGAISSVNNTLFGGSNAPARGQVGYVTGFLGGAVADEPRAAIVARDVLSAGGNAADAAVALAFALSVTLPSRAGLGGGGACLAYSARDKSVSEGTPEGVMFTPVAPPGGGAGADRPAAVPMLPRGLYLLHARYGRLPFESLVVPAEQLARFGTPATRALVRDLTLVAGPLLADPNARAVFAPNGTPLAEGQTLSQPDLASTLTQIRTRGWATSTPASWRAGLSRRLRPQAPARSP